MHALVMKYRIEGHSCVSSFNHELLGELERINEESGSKLEAIYLYNYYENEELPAPDIYATRGKGINISSIKLTKEVIENCHSRGKQVGVWIDRDYFCENEEFYHTIY